MHEQVANKLSVQFADIGEQEVKNIPTPVHAYMVAMRREDGTYSKPQVKKRRPSRRARRTGCGRSPSRVVCLAAIGVGGFLYFTKLEMAPGSKPQVAASGPSSIGARAVTNGCRAVPGADPGRRTPPPPAIPSPTATKSAAAAAIAAGHLG